MTLKPNTINGYALIATVFLVFDAAKLIQFLVGKIRFPIYSHIRIKHQINIINGYH